ncbi:hypothetical protein M9Y10_000048 [Tritrichomonas musculus]|uniref:Uncharacterized protein n=1 Tax=Tritrichomonas musculus TaxID=1915356 RepID=A0ABR2L380_9EUKA
MINSDVRNIFCPGFGIEEIDREYQICKTKKKSLLDSLENFRKYRVDKLLKVFGIDEEEIKEWKSDYQSGGEFLGWTELEAAFWWSVCQRIYRFDGKYEIDYLVKIIEIRDPLTDIVSFRGISYHQEMVKFYLEMNDDILNINFDILTGLIQNQDLNAIVNYFRSKITRTSPVGNQIICPKELFDIRVWDYYQDAANNTIKDVFSKLKLLEEKFNELGALGWKNAYIVYTWTFYKLREQNIRYLEPDTAYQIMENLVKLLTTLGTDDCLKLIYVPEIEATYNAITKLTDTQITSFRIDTEKSKNKEKNFRSSENKEKSNL